MHLVMNSEHHFGYLKNYLHLSVRSWFFLSRFFKFLFPLCDDRLMISILEYVRMDARVRIERKREMQKKKVKTNVLLGVYG